jgi:hypothetical protein
VVLAAAYLAATVVVVAGLAVLYMHARFALRVMGPPTGFTVAGTRSAGAGACHTFRARRRTAHP